MPPPPAEPHPRKTLPQIVEDVGLYPEDAFKFVQAGLAHTVEKLHGPGGDEGEPPARHITGQTLCDGLRQFALEQWGMMARVVLHRWNVTSTLDFGRIVFALVDNGWMQKTDEDTLDDFKNVFDFRAAFEGKYTIPANSEKK
ncbi:MAG TPA: Minf_1886 family protein [Tepidisphaeraceae bacterium]|nr:Minf_1886 family protein [Tepidisphaeraceae bacterium]